MPVGVKRQPVLAWQLATGKPLPLCIVPWPWLSWPANCMTAFASVPWFCTGLHAFLAASHTCVNLPRSTVHYQCQEILLHCHCQTMFAAPSALCLWHSLAGARVGGWPSSPVIVVTNANIAHPSHLWHRQRARRRSSSGRCRKRGSKISRRRDAAHPKKVSKPNAVQLQVRWASQMQHKSKEDEQAKRNDRGSNDRGIISSGPSGSSSSSSSSSVVSAVDSLVNRGGFQRLFRLKLEPRATLGPHGSGPPSDASERVGSDSGSSTALQGS